MMGKDELQKGYVVVDTTIKEIIDKVEAEKEPNQHGYYDTVPLYECKIDRSNLTPEENAVQAVNNWYTERKSEIRLREETLYDLVASAMYAELMNGTKEKLQDKVYDDVMNAPVRSIVRLERRNNNNVFNIEVYDEIGEEEQHKMKYIESKDIEELERTLKQVKRPGSYSRGETTYVWLEKISIGVYPYQTEKVKDETKKLIKKFIRKELTYCIKNDNVIVPDEYIVKGKDGVKEWQELKRSNNKSNNMENRMIKQLFKDRRFEAYLCMANVADKISASYNWSLPSITVDGRWNRGKMDKLVTQILNTKDQKAFMNVQDEEMLSKIKEYWKDRLMEAYNAIDKITVKEIIEERNGR